MAHNILTPTKGYTTVGNTDGVPLHEMDPLLGSLSYVFLSGGTASSYSATASRLPGQPVVRTEYDGIRITAVHTAVDNSRTILEEWDMDIESFFTIRQANEGNTLAATGVSPNGALVAGKLTGDTMMIGRSSSNRILIQQGGTWSAPANLSAFLGYVANRTGGDLERRLSTYETARSRQITVQRRSAAEPAAPLETEVTYDGTIITIADDSEWKTLEITPTGADPLWIATAEFTPTNTNTYEAGTWIVHASGTSFSLQYSADDGRTWSTSPPTSVTNYIYRFRDGTAHWHGPFNAGPENVREWVTKFAHNWAANETASSTHIFDATFDWSGESFIDITWTNSVSNGAGGETTGNDRSITIPKMHIRSNAISDAGNGQQDYQLLVRLSDLEGNGWSVGNATSNAVYTNWLGGATENDQRLRLDFQHTSANLERASQVRIIRGYTTRPGTIHIYAHG